MISILRMLPILLVLGACQTQQGDLPVVSPRATSYVMLETGNPDALDPLIAAVHRRLDVAGFADAKVQKQGGHLRVETPGSAVELDRLIDLLTRPGVLTFNVVDVQANASGYEPNEVREGRWAVPDDSQGGKLRVIFRDAIVTGLDMENVGQGFDGQNHPIIAFQLRPGAAVKFGKATSQLIGRPFAIVLDGHIISAPYIMSPITTGNGQITGSFTIQEAEQLAGILRSGPLPKLTVVERRIIEN